MKAIGAILALFVCAGLAMAAGVDLSKIDRQITKEPTYKSKPHYALLVFGRDATTRVWMVADGDTVYLDRNANGDLTEAGERIELKDFDLTKAQEAVSAAKAGFGDITEPGGKKYRVQGVQNLGVQMKTVFEEQKKAFKDLKGPEAEKQLKQLEDQVKAMENYYMVSIELPGKIQQYTAMTLGTSVADAPVYHFGGPMKMWAPTDQQLTRGSKDDEIRAAIATTGLSKVKSPFGGEPQVLVNCCTEGSVPKDMHPVVEIEFANKSPGGKPIVAKYELKGRC